MHKENNTTASEGFQVCLFFTFSYAIDYNLKNFPVYFHREANWDKSR